MVDEGRVTRLLRSLDERTARLNQAKAEAERSSLWLDAVKYQLVTAVEAVVDVAHHFSSSEGWGPADTNAESVRELGRRGVINEELADSLARAVGFRNVLVHRYVEVDDGIVIATLDRLDEFERFVAEVSAWLLANGS